MSTNTAIVIKSQGVAELSPVSIPSLRDGYVLVKVKAVALNPTDVLHIDLIPTPGTRSGCDFAGVIEEVGPNVTKSFKEGDRIAGVVHGGNAVNEEDGAFAQHIVAKADVALRIPDSLTFEEAATLGVGITTVGQGLYQSLKLPLPDKPSPNREYLLIYGGSTATGALAIQFAKLSGLRVLVTASPKHFDYVRDLGADAVFDYKSETLVEELRKYTGGHLKYVFDCISTEDTARKAVSVLGAGGSYSALRILPENVVAWIGERASYNMTLAYTAIGEAFQFGPHTFPAKPEDAAFARDFWILAEGLLAEGKIRVHKPKVNTDGSGLAAVLKGLDEVRNGTVSGEKLVYSLD
ncbi:chaperonin 10-like protein [Fusarium redolens]|uniref:Chaperonin 10-like protein n=1 Tax=Fusarium redolens TaxID=48865 RepID=A0A9P9G1G9_FUSRE|nr:chaperonin 10-like protein [Fusarium redolens]KAH7227135.1 chaperonin 10-like protein [Fusarium redolens]